MQDWKKEEDIETAVVMDKMESVIIGIMNEVGL